MRALTLLLLAVAAWGDADALARRAEIRLGHGNVEGARALLVQAVAVDPHHARALGLLCESDRWGPAADRLRYLEFAHPLDIVAAERMLEELRDRVIELPSEAWLDLERACLTADPHLAEIAGPRPPLEDPLWADPWMPAHGPLRGEAFGTPAGEHRAALQRIAQRFETEGVARSDTWGRLASLLKFAGDPEGAEAAVARARPTTPGEEVRLAAHAMQCVADPLAWWRTNGEHVLAEAARGRLSDEDWGPLRQACCSAARLLADRRDVEGLVALVQETLPAWPAGEQCTPLVELTSFILLVRLPDEVAAELESNPDPVVACMRAQLLRWMLQEDLAIETLERTVQEAPDCLVAWECLGSLAASFHLRTLQRRASEELLTRAEASGKPCGAGFRAQWVRFLADEGDSKRAAEAAECWIEDDAPDSCVSTLLQTWVRDGRCAIPLPWPHDQREIEHLADLLGEGRRCVDLLSAASSWTVAQAEEVGQSLGEELAEASRFRAAKSLLLEAARVERWSHPQDALLRALMSPPEPDGEVPLLFVFAVHALSADPAFLSLPSSACVRSLVTDPLLEPARLNTLRREAFNAGCRAPGLLSDMARRGAEDALSALGESELSEKRLVEALRTEGPEALARFLDEEDGASAAQFEEATAELAARGGPAPAPRPASERLRSRLWYPAPRGVLARLALEVLSEARQCAVTNIPTATFGPRVDAAIEAYRAELWPMRRFPRVFYHALPWSGSSIVISFPPAPELDEMVSILGAPARTPAAWGRLAELGRAQAERHPLDLRWVVVQHMRVALPVPQELRDRLRETCSRNAAFLAHNGKAETRPELRRRDIQRVLELRKDDAVGPLMTEIGLPYLGISGLRDVASEAIPLLRPRCLDDRDLLQICQAAGNARMRDLAKELRRGLERSDDPGVRDEALRAAWREDKPRVEELMEWARWEGWPESKAALWWEVVLREARGKEEHGLALEAYAEMWKHGLLDDAPEGRFDIDVYDSHGFGEAVLKLVEQGDAPAWAHFALLATANHGIDDEERSFSPSVEALRSEGLLRRWMWIDSLEAMPAERQRTEWQALVDALPRGRAALSFRKVVEGAVTGLVSEEGYAEALALAEAWAERCGDVQLCVNECRWSSAGLYEADSSTLAVEPRTVPRQALAAALLDSGCSWTKQDLPRVQHRLFLDAADRTQDPFVRDVCLHRAASVMMDQHRHEEVLPLLLSLRRNATIADTRQWADRALAEFLVSNPDLAPKCVEILLQDAERLPPPPLQQITEAELSLADDDPARREAATEALRLRGAEALPLLRALHDSTDPEVRARVEELLTRLIPQR